ncbi:hypothetical protein VTH06DRAFT_7067 [Thermothelomyces fergusii]
MINPPVKPSSNTHEISLFLVHARPSLGAAHTSPEIWATESENHQENRSKNRKKTKQKERGGSPDERASSRDPIPLSPR